MKRITLKGKRFLIICTSVWSFALFAFLGTLTSYSQIAIKEQYPWGTKKQEFKSILKINGCFLNEVTETSSQDYIICTEQKEGISLSTQYFFSYDTLVKIGYIVCYPATTKNLPLQSYDSLINKVEFLWNRKAYKVERWLNEYYKSSPDNYYLALISLQYRPSALVESDKDQVYFSFTSAKYDLRGEAGEFIYLVIEICPLSMAQLRIPISTDAKK